MPRSVWWSDLVAGAPVLARVRRCGRCGPRDPLGNLRSASRFDPQVASETAFIATIAKRRLIDRHRRRSRAIDAAPIEEEPALASRAAADSVELKEEAERVRVVMGRLRHAERRVLEMSLVKGLTHSEISQATSLPLGTVKTHARRGLNRLREMLGVNQLSPTPEP